jgi:hypothetical protein
MKCETIIVAYDRPERASAAIASLRQLGVPPGDIKRHPVSSGAIEEVAVATEPSTGSGFFGWLFGRDTVAHRGALYKKALEAGGTVISVAETADEMHTAHKLLQESAPMDWEVGPGGR